MKYRFLLLSFLAVSAACANGSPAFASGTVPAVPATLAVTAQSMDGAYCQKTEAASSQLGLRPNADGSLDMALSIGYSNGHYCGIDGVAYRNSNGWRIDKTADKADPESHCALDIKFDQAKNRIVITQDKSTACKIPYCGNGVSFGEAAFPMQSRIAHMTKWFDPPTFGQAPICDTPPTIAPAAAPAPAKAPTAPASPMH